MAGVIPSSSASKSQNQPKYSGDTRQEESEMNIPDTGPDPLSTID